MATENENLEVTGYAYTKIDGEKPADKEDAPKGDEDKVIEDKEELESASEDAPNPVEEKARSEGWRPKEEWEGDPSDWVDAKEFVFRGELMDRIRQQGSKLNEFSKENKEIKEALKVLGEHNKKIAEQEYKKALADLKKQKVAALEDDDHSTAVDIDDQIDELKRAKSELAEEEEAVEKAESTDKNENQTPPEVNEWLQNDTNKWYHNDPVMRGAADSVFVQHLQFNPDDFRGALKEVEKTMKAYFPEKFGESNPRPRGAAVTESNSRAAVNNKANKQKSKKATVKDLTDEQRTVAKTFVDSGVFRDIQEYVDQLVELGEL